MRYHTAAIIAGFSYVEAYATSLNQPSETFKKGKGILLNITNMEISKRNDIEQQKIYRSYEILYRLQDDERRVYEFTLNPRGGFLSRSPKGDVRRRHPGYYELNRYGNYQESNVSFQIDFVTGSLSGSYYNWHSERGEISYGRVPTKLAVLGRTEEVRLTARGKHYKGSSGYKRASDAQRETTWSFSAPITSASFY